MTPELTAKVKAVAADFVIYKPLARWNDQYRNFPRFVMEYLVVQYVDPNDPIPGQKRIERLLTEHYSDSSERELVRLSLAMAERIVRREIDIDRDLLAVMARVAIDRLGENAVATIHLHPTDCEAAMQRAGGAQPGSVEIVADVNVPRGGCLVRSAFGSIDAGIDAQMRELARALLGDDTGHEEPTHGLPADL